jgi:hypothetical protein
MLWEFHSDFLNWDRCSFLIPTLTFDSVRPPQPIDSPLMTSDHSSERSPSNGGKVSVSDQLNRTLLGNRKALLVLLWGVTGFLGLPLLWISPKFSVTEKLLYSVLITFYSLFLIGMATGIVWWAYLRIVG